MVDFEEEYQQILELLRDYNGWVKRKLQTPKYTTVSICHSL